MSLLNANQRAFVRVQTGIDPLVIDRATEAYDALIEHQDIRRYQLLMGTAIVQMGYGRPVVDEDRPTAVDKIKTILVRAYAERERMSYQDAAKRITRMLQG